MSEMLQEQPKRERFTVDNDMKAEWVLEKIRRVRANRNRQKEELTRQMQFYIDEMARVDEEADSEEEFFKSMLFPYFVNKQENGFAKAAKTQTVVNLPSGKMILKKQEPEFDYKTNQKQTIEWLKKNNGKQFIKTKEELKWRELKDTVKISGSNVVTSDGEVVPGVTVTEREDKFDVEV